MKRSLRRIVSLLCVLALCIGLLPATALAAGDGEYDFVRLMNRDEWKAAVLARAGEPAGNTASFQRFFIYDANHTQMNTGAGAPFLTPDCYYADTYDVSESDIQTIVLSLTSGGKTVSAVFDTQDFTVTGTGGSAESKHIELTLNDRGKGRPAGHQVNFYAELNDETTYSLYDTIYVTYGQTIGSQMPPDPPVGSYEFLRWQTEKSGGYTITADTYVYSDMNVYAAKGTAGSGHAQEYHVMRDSLVRNNALEIEVADHYNQYNGTSFGVESFTIEDIAVNGTAASTNPIYSHNEWKDEGSYYYVYNVSRDPVVVVPENHNDRVEVADITGITVYGKINGTKYQQFIPRSELSITEAQTNVVVEIRVREKLDSIHKELVTTSTSGAPEVDEATIPEAGATVAVPEEGSVTLLYKITVTGDTGAAYNVSDEGAVVVSGYSLTGTIDSTREAVIYVTKTFKASDIDIANGTLTNTATVVPGDDSTIGTDSGDNEDESSVDAEVDGDVTPQTVGYTVQYYYDNVLDDGKTETSSGTVGAVITAVRDKAGTGYCLDHDNLPFTLTADATQNIITVYYATDANGDEIPDSKQVFIKYVSSDTSLGTVYPTEQVVTFGDGVAEDIILNSTATPKDNAEFVSWTDETPFPISDSAAIKYTLKLPELGKTYTFTANFKEKEPVTPTEPSKPTGDEVEELLDKAVTVDCVNSSAAHQDMTFALMKDSYSIGEVTGDNDTGFTCSVTVEANKYVAAYNDKIGVKHSLADQAKDKADITLKWTGSEWSVVEGAQPVTFQVICDDEPVPPAEVAYTVEYYYDGVRYDAYTYTGTGKAGDIISQYPPKSVAGYAVDYTVGLPLTLAVGGANTIKVYYATDKIGGTDPTDPGYPGDGIPDKYQVTIYYTASTGGYITGLTSEVLTIYNGTSYAAVGTVTATGSSAASHWDYSFANWTNNAGAPVFYTYAFGPVAISNAVGGQTYTFTANFTWSWYPVNPPVIPNPPVDNGPEDLNTEEHVAYIVGFEDGTIRPEANITRAEVATIFFRLLTSEARAQYWSQTNAFTDVSSGDWYNNAVSTLANMGILGGYSDGTFRPSQPITRSEFVKIAVSFFKYADSYAYDGRFTDVEGDEWYVSFLAAAVNFGLIEGMPDGTFQPEAYISRAEACTIVNRTLGRAPHKDYLLPLADMLTWPDNTNRNAWYYEAMQEATNSHDYTWIMVNGEKVESWTAKLAERNWAALEQQWSNAYSAAGSEVIK